MNTRLKLNYLRRKVKLIKRKLRKKNTQVNKEKLTKKITDKRHAVMNDSSSDESRDKHVSL